MNTLRARVIVATALLGVCSAACTQPFDPSLIQGSGGSVGLDGSGADASADAPQDVGSDACQGCWDLGCQPGNAQSACGSGGAECKTCQLPTPFCFEGDCVAQHAPAGVAAGAVAACLITVESKLYCWGANNFGELAMSGSVGKATLVSSIQDVAHLAMNPDGAYAHSCARTSSNALYCYGNNVYGQIGAGDVDGGADPEQVDGAWLEVTAGMRGTCAIDDQSHVWCWGARLGTLSKVPNLIAGEGQWRGLSAAHEHACAIKASENDALYCWGDQLSFGPVGGGNWKQIDVGHEHVCGIRNDRLWCWGNDTYGQLGLDLPSGPKSVPEEIGTSQWKSVSAGTRHTCAIQSDKSLWCWGSNEYGQLGIGHNLPAAGPQRVGDLTSWEAVAAGHDFNCAIGAARVVHCWGKNKYGQTSQPKVSVPEVHVPTPILYAE
jgi:alpha-tubulin suppressor-like RCC1 family protein